MPAIALGLIAALHLRPSKHKLICSEKHAFTSANAICHQWVVRLVQPIASNRAERRNYALLTTNWVQGISVVLSGISFAERGS